MSRNDLRIRPAEARDTPAILDLMKACFKDAPNAWSRAFWTWKHVENPFGRSPVLVAEAPGGQVVGVRAFLRWQWQRGGERVEAVRAVDTAVHPDWRGRGLFTRLTMRLVERMQEEGVAFVFNTPNAQSRPGYLKMGWTLVDQFSRWVRPVRIVRCLRAVATASPSSTWREVAESRFPGVEELLSQVAGAPSFLSRLMQGAAPRYRTPLSEAYLRWRYAEIPNFFYRAAWAFDGDAGAAVIFRLSSTRRDLRVAALSEVLVLPARRSQRMARALLKKVMRASEADYMTATPARRSPERRVLMRSGFLPLPGRGPHLTVRPLNASACPLDPRERSHWRLGLGELEVF